MNHTHEQIRAALAERNRNVERFWDELHDLGFRVVDERGVRIRTPATAGEVGSLGLERSQAPRFAMDRRRGFFTHSLIGNALLLLTAGAHAHISTGISLQDIVRQPNRHCLANAIPVDLGDLVLIRHGETEANRHGVALGRSDGALGWRGVLLDQSSREPPAGVEVWHRSSLLRTEQTASCFGVNDAICHVALDEMEIGVAEGLPETLVVKTLYSAHLMYVRGDPFAAIVDEFNLSDPAPPGESFVALLLRVTRCLQDEVVLRA